MTSYRKSILSCDMPRQRRKGVVDPPSLDVLSAAKKPRLDLPPVSVEPARYAQWSRDEVCAYLREKRLPDAAVEAFNEHEIAGRHLQKLSPEDLAGMGILAVGVQKDLLELFAGLSMRHSLQQGKVFNDPIHGHIELHPLLVRIIDTPQFQRLRDIKQLGGGYYVFLGASHNRFEHSIGVGYLAGELVEALQRKQPELGISPEDVLCVKVAGLCHDLGHGPFSHMFDHSFIPAVRPDITWKHEFASTMMFDHLLEENGLRDVFASFNLGEKDISFIKEQIAGPIESELSSQHGSKSWPYKGRPESKSFLYEIVANKRNGIDVDKWDYFARDCHCLGIPNNFDMRRYMKFARVIDVNDRRQICTRDKEVLNLYEMFHTRTSLHRRAYQHKTCNIIERMLVEALLLANDHFTLTGTGGRPVRMSEAIYDPVAYTELTDHVLYLIRCSTSPQLEESRRLLQRIQTRQLYKCVGQTQPASDTDFPKPAVLRRELVGALEPEELDGLPSLSEADFHVDVVTFDYGMKSENPIDHVRFYMKEHPSRAVKVRKDQVSQMLPQTFREQDVRVYCKKTDPASVQAARKYFRAWCLKQDCITPKGEGKELMLEDFTPYGTPFGTPLKEEGEDTPPLNQDSFKKRLTFTTDMQQ